MLLTWPFGQYIVLLWKNATEEETAFFLITCARIIFSVLPVGCRYAVVCLGSNRWLLFLCIAQKLVTSLFFEVASLMHTSLASWIPAACRHKWQYIFATNTSSLVICFVGKHWYPLHCGARLYTYSALVTEIQLSLLFLPLLILSYKKALRRAL